MVQVQYGAVKFKSIKAAAEAVAKQTGEPVGRAYMRLYMRKRAGKLSWKKARKYTMN